MFLMVQTKGGRIAPYSSFIALVPALDIGVAALMGAELDETMLCRNVLSAILPSLYKYIVSAQPGPVPASPSIGRAVSGMYCVVIEGMNLTMNVDVGMDEVVVFSAAWFGTIRTLWMGPLHPNVFQSPVASDSTCERLEMDAAGGEYIYFSNLSEKGSGSQFQIPGLQPGIVFQKPCFA